MFYSIGIQIIYIFILGACVGSFLNVVSLRLPKKKSSIFPRSSCNTCNKKLNPIDLIPIISWLYLKGKCRYCNTKLSLRYPLIELITAILFVLCIKSNGFISEDSFVFFDLISGWILVSYLILLAIIDIDLMILPNSLTFTGSIIAFFLIIFNNYFFNNFSELFFIEHLYAYLIGLFGIYIFSYIVNFIFNKPAFGFGDAKLFAMSGAWLGLSGLEVIITLSFLLAGIFVFIGFTFKSIRRGDYIPFGPFICISTFLVWIFSSDFWIDTLDNIFWWKFI